MATGTSYHTRLGSPPANGWTPSEITLKAVTGKQSAGMKEVTAAHPLANFQRHAATLEIQPKLYFARENERLDHGTASRKTSISIAGLVSPSPKQVRPSVTKRTPRAITRDDDETIVERHSSTSQEDQRMRSS